jgi:hypothetical protein
MAPDPYDLPVASPLGAGTVSGTTVSVDMLTKPVTRIAPQIRDLVADNEGYFAEDIFATPGFTVEGGAILYSVLDAGDHFLDEDQGLAPRAPLAETPLVGAKRKGAEIARVESWAGAFEVADEVRRRNNVGEVQIMMRKVANSLAEKMQDRAMTTLADFVATHNRSVAGNGWRGDLSGGVVNVNPAETIIATLALIEQTFIEDKAGVKPDTLIVNPADLYYARLTLPGSKLRETLADYGITKLRSSIRQEEGSVTAVRSGQVGYIAFETPLNTEQERLTSGRRGDRYNLEATPVFVANDTTSVLEVTGVDATPA